MPLRRVSLPREAPLLDQDVDAEPENGPELLTLLNSPTASGGTRFRGGTKRTRSGRGLFVETLRIGSLTLLTGAALWIAVAQVFPHWFGRTLSGESPSTPTGGSPVVLAAAPEGVGSTPTCQRCPAGSCDVSEESGECKWYPPPIDGNGAYHCSVRHCSEVPHHKGVSGCWQYRGHNFFSVVDSHFPCQDRAEDRPGDESRQNSHSGDSDFRGDVLDDGLVKEAANKKVEAKIASEIRDAVEKAKSGAKEERKGRLGHGRSNHSHQSEAAHQARAEKQPKSTTRSTTTSNKAKGIFDLGANEITNEEKLNRDPRLAAYWDIGGCGPGADDQNSDWCGGLVHKPDCQQTVPADSEICESGHATLHYVSLKEDGSSAWTYIEGCSYEYFAQYSCLPVTSTTTTTTTITTTTTTITTTITTTTTTSTTTTTTTTVRTTTRKAERDMLRDMADLESELGMMGESNRWRPESGLDDPSCMSTFRTPKPPALATDLNGIRLPDVCIRSPGPHYVYVIGDWGGILGPHGPTPANQRSKEEFVDGVDDVAQIRVANQMRWRAKRRSPDYILQMGDAFYWSGLNVKCGTPAYQVVPTGQFQWVFEDIYKGEGLDGKPWLGVLGNHDYGGYKFDQGWDQLIAYTWGTGGRWILPAQYWRQKVKYPGFSVDYFFVDTNVYTAQAPSADAAHNICSNAHVKKEAGCGQEGPKSVEDCPAWFAELWAEQIPWLDANLGKSTADWQIVVTHFPPTWGMDYWVKLAAKHGIDLFLTGHQHDQELHLGPDDFLHPTAWVVSGGGGGITSEGLPNKEGHDDQYGFFELTLTKEVIEIQGLSHGGQVRYVGFVKPRPKGPSLEKQQLSKIRADLEKELEERERNKKVHEAAARTEAQLNTKLGERRKENLERDITDATERQQIFDHLRAQPMHAETFVPRPPSPMEGSAPSPAGGHD